MRRKLFKFFKGLAVGLSAVILVSVGIDAADNYDAYSESVLGRLIFGKSEGPCSADMVFIPTEKGGFCLDKYESSANEKCPNNSPVNQSDTRLNLEYADCAPVSAAKADPWRFISQTQAMAACAKAGKRLPTGEEWFLASQGTPDPAENWSKDDCQVAGNWDSQPGLTSSGGKCVSAYGAYDMIGNVWEWVKGEISDGAYEGRVLPDSGYVISADSRGLPLEIDKAAADENFGKDYFWIKEGGVRGIARGGYWDNKSDAGVFSSYLVSPPSFAGTGIGFRCAK